MVERIRAQTLAEDQLTQQLQELTEAKERAIETVAQLRTRERKLREQAHARAAVESEMLEKIRGHLGIPSRTADPPQPPEQS